MDINNLPRYLNIEKDPHLIRDRFSMGVVNTNRSGYLAALRRKELAMKQITGEEQRKMEINSLRSEVTELKALLLQVLEKVK